MKRIAKLSEILLGIIFLVAGLNGYFVLFGLEPFAPTSAKATEFLGDGYLLAMEKGVEIIAGLLLLLRRFVTLVLIVLASLIVNILAFHLFIDSELLLLALLLVVLEGFLVWYYRDSYKDLIISRPEGK